MGIPVLILGESGSGKSASLRNFSENEIGVINVASKPLPFKSKIKPYNVSKVSKGKWARPLRINQERYLRQKNKIFCDRRQSIFIGV
jgi:hypothetical protein